MVPPTTTGVIDCSVKAAPIRGSPTPVFATRKIAVSPAQKPESA
jgi:hypothetical protein